MIHKVGANTGMDIVQRLCEGVDRLSGSEQEPVAGSFNTVMNLQFPYRWGISRVAELLLTSQEAICSMELVMGYTAWNGKMVT
jgi:hypothetical protein